MQINASIDRRDVDRFADTLSAYLEANQRAQGPLLDKRAVRVRLALMRAYLAIAPEAGQIELEARSRGYALKRGFRRSGKRRTYEQEIKARRSSRGYLGASFATKGHKANPRGQNATFTVQSRRRGAKLPSLGKATVQTTEAARNPFVSLVSYLEGVKEQDTERGIVSEVLNAEVKDMTSYLLRKQQQALGQLAANRGKVSITA